MPSIRAHGLSFGFTDARPLFSDLDLHLATGWTGVVGENGCGKTTLLRLLAGELAPDGGHLQREPAGLRIALCPQTVEQRERAVEDFAWSEEPAHYVLRGQLDLEPHQLARWDSLSPGERKRWQIAAALADEPDLLLLDEPTNHLDVAGRRLLLAALRRFRGIGLVVSHDRALLEGLTRATLRCHRGTARVWPGPYSQARAAWQLEEQQGLDERRAVAHQKQVLEARLADARRDRDSAQAQRSTGARMKGRKDSDARTLVAQTRVGWAEAQLSRRVETIRHRVERTAESLAALPMEKAPGRSIFLDYEPAPSSRILALELDELRAGESVLARDLHLVVGRASRIRIAGPNGAGKSTLLAALMRAGHLPESRLLYLPQELQAAEERAMLQQLRALPPEERGRVLSLVAALGTEPDQLLRTEAPSPGEARKLRLALGLGRNVWAALLDEPTNHLDLPSIERLETALRGYPGALVLVSHDDAFAQPLAENTWHLRDGKVEVE